MKSGGKLSDIKNTIEKHWELWSRSSNDILDGFRKTGEDVAKGISMSSASQHRTTWREAVAELPLMIKHALWNEREKFVAKHVEGLGEQNALVSGASSIGANLFYFGKAMTYDPFVALKDGAIAQAEGATRSTEEFLGGYGQQIGAISAIGGAVGGAGVVSQATSKAASLAISQLAARGSELAVSTVAVATQPLAVAAGLVAGGATGASLMSATEGAKVEGGGGNGGVGRGGRRLTLDELDWGGRKTLVRTKSNDALIEWAEETARGLERETQHHSPAMAELMARELKRRSSQGVNEIGQKITPEAAQKMDALAEKLMSEAKQAHPDLDWWMKPHRTGPEGDLPRYLSKDLIAEAKFRIGEFTSGRASTNRPFHHRALIDELRDRSLGFEGEEVATMRSLANDLEGFVSRGPAVRNAQVIDMGGIIQRFDDATLMKEAHGALGSEGGLGGPQIIAEELRSRAMTKGLPERWRMNWLAERLERKAERLRMRQEVQDAEALRRLDPPAADIPPPRPLAELSDAEFRAIAEPLINPNPRGTIAVRYTLEELEAEIARRGLR